jgi:hypothetical protein
MPGTKRPRAPLALHLAAVGALSSAACTPTNGATEPAAFAPPPRLHFVGPSRAVGDTDYALSLDDSPERRQMFEDRCSRFYNTEAGRVQCFRTEASDAVREGVRFERNGRAQWVFFTYRKDLDEDEIILDRIVLAAVEEAGPGRFVGWPDRDQGKTSPAPPPPELLFETPDDATVVLYNQHGKLVFKKR